MRTTRPGNARAGARAALLGLAVALAGCNVVFDAPEVSLVVQDDAIVFAGPDDSDQLVGGETVLKIANDSTLQGEIVLARLDNPPEEGVPQELVKATSPGDDSRILAMSPVLEPQETRFAGGGVAFITARASFHEHLRTGETYVLFNRLGGLERGVVLYFEPGPNPEWHVG